MADTAASVAQLPAPSEGSGGGWIDDGAGGCQVDYQIYDRYIIDYGVAQLPIASSDAQDVCVFVRLAQPTWGIRVDWTVKKEGKPPKLPAFDLGDPDLVLIQHEVETHAVKTTGLEGNMLCYRASGTYYYGAKTSKPTEYKYPAPPWVDNKLVTGLTIKTSDFLTKVQSVPLGGPGGGASGGSSGGTASGGDSNQSSTGTSSGSGSVGDSQIADSPLAPLGG